MDYIGNPKFIHNLWTYYNDCPDIYSLRTSKGYFEVDKQDAEDFLKFRGLCTGYNSQEKISEISGIPKKKISEMISSLNDIGCIRNIYDEDSISSSDIFYKICTACSMWAEQLEESHIFNAVLEGEYELNILKGLLLETYHYIRLYPECLKSARDSTDDEDLKNKLDIYYKQELGHEVYVIDCLIKLGFTKNEITESIPLVSTQSLLNMISSIFTKYPYSVPFIATVIEAEDYNEEIANNIRNAIQTNFGIGRDVLDGLIEHMKIDYELGHANIIDAYKNNIKIKNLSDAHDILNSIHDIKHAFDVQKLEIIDYYSHAGNYIPRQRVDYFGV